MDFEEWLANNKALWARVYNEVMVPDLEKEWKKRNEIQKAESTTQDDRFQYLNHHISNGVVEKAQLVEENARLKNLLWHTRDNTPSAEEIATNTDDATIPITEYRKVTEKLDELNKRFQVAAQRIKYLERKNVAVMQKNKEMKESVKAWQEYCDRHIEKKGPKAEPKGTKVQPRSNLAIETSAPMPDIPSSPGSAAMVTPRLMIPQERSSPVPMAESTDAVARPRTPLTTSKSGEVCGNVQAMTVSNDHGGHENIAEPTESGPCSPPQLPTTNDFTDASFSTNNGRAAPIIHVGSDKINSSQTTVPEIMDQENETGTCVVSSVDDDDEPELVSERSLKRKRKQSTGFKVFQDGFSDGTPAKPVRVKEEQYSSPPPESTGRQLLRKETMDLDELGPNPIMTPRRQRLRRMASTHSKKTGTLHNQRSSSAPFSGLPVKPEPTEEVHMPDVRHHCHLAIALEDARAMSEPGHVAMEARDILQPIDPNMAAGRSNEITPNKRARRAEARWENKFDMITESGETPTPTNERKKRLPPNLARAHFNERIRAAKSSLSPTRNTLVTPKTAPARTTAAQIATPPSSHRPAYTPSARPAQRKVQEPVPRPELVPDGRPVWRMDTLEPAHKAPLPPAPESLAPDTHLRDKPVTDLRMHDFKPNPAYNGGYTHAFTDTVRRRDDRLCLPGCTNPACCGSTFRTLALAAASLSASQEDALLREYLGDAYDAFGLTQMDAAERDEIVLQARTRKMATQHGKHRRAYEGRRTPPGFWRVDFPDTQEREEDREKAVQMEMQEVRVRYLEAMRRGGRFVFADE